MTNRPAIDRLIEQIDRFAPEQFRANPDWASLPLFDRTGWRRVRFGDVVANVNETVSDPAAAGIERFIGLEHLEPGTLHVRSWGNVADGTTFTRRCRPGQVLFGKRRAYQRKVAVAEFDAVVSGDIYVLQSKDERELLPELLPYICLSEKFFEHAVGTSAGSLSPRTNWSSLASFEFALPAVEQQQRQIATLLHSVEEDIEAGRETLSRTTILKRVSLEQTAQSVFPVVKLREAVRAIQYGLSCSLVDSGEYPVLRMMNYDEEMVVPNVLKYADLDKSVAEKYVLTAGDILFNRTNSADLVGKAGLFDLRDQKYVFASYLLRIATDPSKLIPEFLNFYLNSATGQAAIRTYATPGVSQSNISASSVESLRMPLPPLARQRSIVESVALVSDLKRQLREGLEHKKELLTHTIDRLIG